MPEWFSFIERVQQLQSMHRSDVCLFLNPVFERLPLPITRHDDPLFPFSKAIVDATRDLACAYMFDLASYMALGAAGVVALERSIRYAGVDTITILHGPFTGSGYSRMADVTGFGVDAITTTRKEDLAQYLQSPPYAAFLAEYEGVRHDVPLQGGVYRVYEKRLEFFNSDNSLVSIRLTDEEVLHAGKLDDYAERIREAVEAFI